MAGGPAATEGTGGPAVGGQTMGPVSTPPTTGGSGRRRGRPSGTSAQPASTNVVKSAEVAPAPRRKKRKVPEKEIPTQVAAFIPESMIYNQLLEFEKRVDSTLARKKLDIQEGLKNPARTPRTLRMYIFNTHTSQLHGRGGGEGKEDGNKNLMKAATGGEKRMGEDTKGGQGEPDGPPSWTLRIVGRLLEDESQAEDGANGAGPAAGGVGAANPMAGGNNSNNTAKFSTFFRRITVELDHELYPDNHTVVWDSDRAVSPVEGFEIKRRGDKEFVAKLKFELNYVPERHKVSPELGEILGVHIETRARILSALWQYIKSQSLQDPSDPTFIICDARLKALFNGEERVRFSSVARLQLHLSPAPPILLEHTIRLGDRSPAGGDACYDISVDAPSGLMAEMADFMASMEKAKEIEECDEAIGNAIRKINDHRRRRAFFLGFSKSPVDFVNALVACQSRDLRVAAGDAGRNAERERRSHFYNQPWVEDAVMRYLNRRLTSGADPVTKDDRG
ncbi:hypothetical protein CBR_g12928 [Chara braunii]|uniref:DM2 domain-containing protein n=1 Tax=Chara braunii TaxID=69332 RepID=A0A388KT22_CHABU|nr:hypothetical protein CBR_g12928 [Chara braunii]|eukprot:GBG73211.1 hypothetical protein CBR_g12928 [Chara braunii]